MRKLIIFLCILLLLTTSYGVELDSFDADKIAVTLSEFENEFIDASEYQKLITDIQNGNFSFDYKKVFGKAWIFLVNEIKTNCGLAIQIIIIAILMGFLENLKGSFGTEGVSQIAFYVCYMLLITLVAGSFIQVYNIAFETISDVSGFMKVLFPILIGLVVATGNITAGSMIYPIIIFSTEAVTMILSNIILPIAMIAFALGMVSNISSKITVSRIGKLLRTFSLWTVGIILTVFTGIVSLEGTIGATIDGVTAKTAKFLFGTGVPVVGKLLGDSIDTIIGSTLILKDSIGIIGIGTVLGLILYPILKILVLLLIYSAMSALIQPFADERICKVLSDTTQAGQVVLSVVITIAIMFIIGSVGLIKMSNTAVMISS